MLAKSTIASVLAACSYATMTSNHHKLFSEKANMTIEKADEFIDYVSKYQKKYESEDHMVEAAKNYDRIDQFIQEWNSNPENTSTVGHNKFSDLSKEQRKSLTSEISVEGFESEELYSPYPVNNVEFSLSGNVDWVSEGYVGAVPDINFNGIEDCSSSYAATTASLMSSAYYMWKREMVQFSSQQLMDCPSANLGCRTGSVAVSLGYLETHTLESNATYPYTATDGTCNYNETNGLTYGFGSLQIITQSPKDLQIAVNGGPVATAFDSHSDLITQYTGGVINDAENCGTEVNAYGLIVGYGMQNGLSYWLVQNTWGTDWGDGGYFKVAVHEGAGTCGVQILLSQTMMMQRGFATVYRGQWVILLASSFLLIFAPFIVIVNRNKFRNMKDSSMPIVMTAFLAIINITVITIVSANYAQGYSYPNAWFNVFVYWFGAIVINLLSPTFNMSNHSAFISEADNHDDTTFFKSLKAINLLWPICMCALIIIGAFDYIGSLSIKIYTLRQINISAACVMIVAILNQIVVQYQVKKHGLYKNDSIEYYQLALSFFELVQMTIILSCAAMFPGGSHLMYGLGYGLFEIFIAMSQIISIYGMVVGPVRDVAKVPELEDEKAKMVDDSEKDEMTLN